MYKHLEYTAKTQKRPEYVIVLKTQGIKLVRLVGIWLYILLLYNKIYNQISNAFESVICLRDSILDLTAIALRPLSISTSSLKLGKVMPQKCKFVCLSQWHSINFHRGEGRVTYDPSNHPLI